MANSKNLTYIVYAIIVLAFFEIHFGRANMVAGYRGQSMLNLSIINQVEERARNRSVQATGGKLAIFHTDYPTFSKEMIDSIRESQRQRTSRRPTTPRPTTKQDAYADAGRQLAAFFYSYRTNVLPGKFNYTLEKCKNEADSNNYACYAKCVCLKMGYFITGRGLQVHEIKKLLTQVNPTEIDVVEERQLEDIIKDLELCGIKWPEQVADRNCHNQEDFWKCVRGVFIDRLDIYNRRERMLETYMTLGRVPSQVIH